MMSPADVIFVFQYLDQQYIMEKCLGILNVVMSALKRFFKNNKYIDKTPF